MRVSTSQIYQNSIDSIMTQQARLLKLQKQLSDNGVVVQSPSDDPVAAAQIELLFQRISTAQLLQNNRGFAVDSLHSEESILNSTVKTIQRLREIQVQAGNPSLPSDVRNALAIESQNLLNQLQDLANSKDANGGYLFSGSQTATQPITLNASGQFVYNGDSNQRYQVVTGSLQVALNDTGDNLFMNILNGNGRFAITSPVIPNNGTASVTTGSVINPASYVADNYTLSFALNSSGQLVTMVQGVASGNVIPSDGLPDSAPLYQEGGAINFNGMQVVINGAPQEGDNFLIKPSTNESLFSTVQRMVANLNKPFNTASEKAATQTENNQLLAQLDNALVNVTNVESDLGGRLHQLEIADVTNTDIIQSSTEALKRLRETDPTILAGEYKLQLTSLQVAQQTYAKIFGLSLFNYI